MYNNLDSRDIIERIEELKAQDELDDEDQEELSKAEALIEELGDEAESGIYLIHENNFEDYAREFAEDIGAIDSDSTWPATCIDWERAADELRMDYSEIEYDGETYYYR